MNKVQIMIVFLFLFGCSMKQKSTELPALPTTTITMRLPSITPTQFTATVTATRTTQPSPTRISTLTNTVTPVPSTTPTAGPTMRADEAILFIKEQQKLGEDCNPLCWWDIQPGVTSFDDISPSLLMKGMVPQKYYNTYYFLLRIQESDARIAYGQTYILGNQKRSMVVEAINIGASMVKSGSLNYKDPRFYNLFENYKLGVMLLTFGRPEEILLFTTQIAGEGGKLPFRIIINYYSKGISILYDGFVQVNDEQYLMCPNQTSFNLFIWSPNLSDPNIVGKSRSDLFISQQDLIHYKELEVATSLSVDEFMEQYTTPGGNQCLSTPVSIW